jgi:putative hydrolase of the HAD superfamily
MLSERDIRRRLRPLNPIPTALSPAGGIPAPAAGLLFDIYGTLFVSGSGDVGSTRRDAADQPALAALLDRYSIPYAPADLLEQFFCAIERAHTEARRTGIDFPEVDVRSIWQGVLGIRQPETLRDFALEFELLANPVYPMPHLETMMAALRRRQLPLGIISNAQFYTPLLFRWFFGSEPSGFGFDPELTVYSYRFGRAKPSPRLFEHVAAILARRGIAAASVLYVGNDMLNDIFPAHAVGFRTVLFAGDSRSLRLRADHPQCAGLRADAVVTDLMQLVEMVDRHRGEHIQS